MQTKSDQRAVHLTGRALFSGHDGKQAASASQNHAASHHERAKRPLPAARRTSARIQARGGASMTYQLGFTSGPSG